MTLRELVVKLGFDVDKEKLKEADEGINKVLETVKHVAEVLGVIEAGKEFLKIADEEERTQMALEAFSGSAEKAKNLLKGIGDFIDSGGVTFPEDNIKNAAQELLTVGVNAEKVVPLLKQIGDVAAITGKGDPGALNELTGLYAQVQSRGVLVGRQLRSFPIMVEPLARQLGVSREQLFKMQIPAAQFNEAFQKMSETNFADGMVRSSHTWSGLLQVIKNVITSIAEEIGTNLLPIAKEFGLYVLEWFRANKEGLVKTLTAAFEILGRVIALIVALIKGFIGVIGGGEKATDTMADSLEELQKIVEVACEWIYKMRGLVYALIIAYGIWRVVMIANAIGLALQNNLVLKLIFSLFRAGGVTKMFAAVQWALNAAMAANPVGAIILGIIALIAVVVIAIRNWNTWGAALTLVLGPIGAVIRLIKTLYDHWGRIKEAFASKGMLAGFLEIGRAILDSVILPIQQLLGMLSKIPGVGKALGAAAKGLKAFRESTLHAAAATDSKGEGVPHYAKGTNYVPQTGLAMIHKGEQIIPAGASSGGYVVHNQISAPVTIQVPQGTTIAQSEFLRRYTQKIFDENWQKILQQTKMSTRGINATGGV